MIDFMRFDKSDYDRLAVRDRLTACDAVTLFVNSKKDLDKSFDCHYWRMDALNACLSLLNNEFISWHRKGKLTFYGPEGDLGQPLTNENDFLVANEGDAYLNDNVFVMKNNILFLFEELDGKATKRIKGLLEGKFWKEPRADVSEKDLVQIIAKRLIEAEDKLPSIDAIIKDINLSGIGNDASKSTLYDWIGEVYPA